jgi:thiol-disulfide isomerase/thioredoxin
LDYAVRMTRFRSLLRSACIALPGLLSPASAQSTFTQILPLKPEEGVFAYSRISADGKLLSYASERRVNGTILRTANVVELATKRLLFSEPGVDAYWSPDGAHLIYLSVGESGDQVVCTWHRADGTVTRNVAPQELGHYFSWAKREGRDLVLTQDNFYYFLEEGRAQKPYRTVPAFPPLGAGTQPMINRDGTRIATFYRGTVLVRGLDDPSGVVETHLRGGKADFSFDGRYVAFHSAQKGPQGKDTYQISVVDLQTKEVIQATNLPGSCYYPSWTKDGRLVFRYDSPEYRGFMMASNVLSNPRKPLPTAYPDDATTPGVLADLLGRTPAPKQKVVMVNFWAGWCVHCRGELPVLNQLRQELRRDQLDAEILGACDPTSFTTDREFILKRSNLDLPQIDITSKEVNAFGVQVYPTTLMFVDGKLVDKHQGALTRKGALALFQKHGIRVKE